MLYPLDNALFHHTHIGPLHLHNRMVMAPMTRGRAGAGNAPTALNAEYYAQRASAGLIITEPAQVSPAGAGAPRTPGLHTDEQVAGWRLVTEAVHERGGRIFVQLGHAGRVSHPSLQPGRALPVAPSAIRPAGSARTPSGALPYATPRALPTGEIPLIVQQFVEAALRAREAGFDGVEIDAGGGHLIDQFLRDGSNHRTDRYGGSIANRARLLLEIVDAVARAWSPDRVGVRLSPASALNDMRDSHPRATFCHVAEQLNRRGLAYLHVVEPAIEPAVARRDPHGRITLALRQMFRGPLMVNGGYDSVTGDQAISSGEADLISYGVPFLANPDLPVRFATGASLNQADRATFHGRHGRDSVTGGDAHGRDRVTGGDARGYTDYPTLDQREGDHVELLAAAG